MGGCDSSQRIPSRLEWQSMVNEVMLPVSRWWFIHVGGCQNLWFRVGRSISHITFMKGDPFLTFTTHILSTVNQCWGVARHLLPWQFNSSPLKTLLKARDPLVFRVVSHFSGVNSLVNFGWFTQGCEGCCFRHFTPKVGLIGSVLGVILWSKWYTIGPGDWWYFWMTETTTYTW